MKWNLADLTLTFPLLIANREFGEIAREVRSRFYSDENWYLLCRDLSQSFPPPSAKIPFRIRPIVEADFPKIRQERPIRLPALKAGLSTCYVALTDDDDICYMQWLIDSSQNHLIETRFKGLCPPLAPDEMQLEWAYTFRRFRGLGLMAAAMSRISELAASRGARWLFTYVECSNLPSLKGCRSSNFRPYKLREDHWRFFHCSERLNTLPSGTKYDFE